MQTVGFIGLGNLGTPMAQNIQRAGVEILLTLISMIDRHRSVRCSSAWSGYMPRTVTGCLRICGC